MGYLKGSWGVLVYNSVPEIEIRAGYVYVIVGYSDLEGQACTLGTLKKYEYYGPTFLQWSFGIIYRTNMSQSDEGKQLCRPIV